MDLFEQLRNRTRLALFVTLVIENLLLIGLLYAGLQSNLPIAVVLGSAVVLCLIAAGAIGHILGGRVTEPLKAVWQAILHISPTDHGIAAPEKEKLKLGRELVASLTAQVYQLTESAKKTSAAEAEDLKDVSQNFIAQKLPLPLVVLDPAENIRFANQAFADYIGIAAPELIGKNVYMVLDMSFVNDDTLDRWLKEVRATSATATSSWERVRLNVRDNHPALLFDLAAYYNRDNPEHLETMLVLFDHTKQYSQDDQAVSFVALSVHELRTPLTLLRGYIEVFEEELAGKINPELQGFMEKMRSQAEQLMAFVNNILNVARVDNDQLELRLEEADWNQVLNDGLAAMKTRAKVRDIALECTVAPDLPTVGVDRLSIYEVIANLVDNAIKYSAGSKVIKIDAHLNQSGQVETTVQDFGHGISTSILPNLFTKFYRDHRNRAQIGGTGLGLYLSKAIITAHGGQLWVNSKEGEGSTFGFSLIPYAQLSSEAKQAGDTGMVRSAHGWIKNHSLYRR
jgi:signal transduction histidine kinase